MVRKESEEYERQVTLGSEVATLVVGGVLLLTAALPTAVRADRAALAETAVLLLAFDGVWFHLLPVRSFGRWRFAAGTAVVQVITAFLIVATGGVDSDYFIYFLLPVLATAFVPPRATVVTAGIALAAFVVMAAAALVDQSSNQVSHIVTRLFALLSVAGMSGLIGGAATRTRRALHERTTALSTRNQELDVVRRAALSLGRARGEEEIVQAIFAAAREATRAELALLLFAAGGGFAKGLAASASGVERFETNPGLVESPGRVAVRERRSVLMHDSVAENASLSPDIRGKLGVRAGIFVPLIARDQPFGLVILAARSPTQWTPDEVRLAEGIAEASAAAAARYAAIADLRAEAEALAERGRVLQGIDTLVDALAVARDERDAGAAGARSLVEIFRLRGASVLLVDASRAILEVRNTAGQARPHPVVPDPGSCPAIRLGRAFRVDTPASPFICPYMPADGGPYLCLPLVAAAEPVGAIFLEPPEGASLDERAARSAADRIALTVGNARVLETVRRQATTDGLTGLYNRRFFEEQARVVHSLAERHAEPYSVIAIDMDRLKALNDGMGHEAGDEALRVFAGAMRSTIRASDVAARTGGDEFVVLAPQTSLEEAIRTAERVRSEVDRLSRGRTRAAVSISAGVACWRPGRTLQEVTQAADAMLYRAKSSGRDRVVSEAEGPA